MARSASLPERLLRPHRSAVGRCRGLAGLPRAEQLRRIRQRRRMSPGENGGIKGHVVYASTRPFDDPQLLVQTQWEPLVAHVTINLYQEGFAAGRGHPDADAGRHDHDHQLGRLGAGFPVGRYAEHELPGPGDHRSLLLLADNQPQYLDFTTISCTAPRGRRRCRPTRSTSATTACTTGTRCSPRRMTACMPSRASRRVARPRAHRWAAPIRRSPARTARSAVANPTDGTPMLPAGKYVVEVVVPPGVEIVKEEDKNILIGDDFIAPVTQQIRRAWAISSSFPIRRPWPLQSRRRGSATTPTTPRIRPRASARRR